MIRRSPVQSSNITEVAYDDSKQIMEVTFASGQKYTYAGVQQDLFNRLLSANSVGQYFHTFVRDSYPAEPGSLEDV